MDAHRHPLGEADEGEDRIDLGETRSGCRGVGDADAAREALHPAAQDLWIAHELHLRHIAVADLWKEGLLEIGVHPEGIRVDQGEPLCPTLA